MAQWISSQLISSQFAIQVGRWIRTSFTTCKVGINLKILKEQENTIKNCNQRIKLLENMILKKYKKHKRRIYPESNVVYIVKDPENKNNRKYIIDSTINLKVRLSIYNKDSDHEVIYYKGFESEEVILLAEKIVLSKLDHYREKVNKDIFI